MKILVKRIASLITAFTIAASLVVSILITASAGPAGATLASANLQAASGQYTPITPVKAADTRYGTGGVQVGPVGSLGYSTSITFSVLGIGAVPISGVSAVLLNISAVSPQGSGYISAYTGGTTDPTLALFNWNDNVNANGADVVAPGSNGSVTLTVYGSTDAQLSVSVRGWFSDDSAVLPGSTYVPLNWTLAVDTRTGTGTPGNQTGPLPGSGGTISIPVVGQYGIPTSAVSAVSIELGAIGGTNSGFLVDGPSGGPTNVPAVVSYGPNHIYRTPDVVIPSTNGSISISNMGTRSVGLQVLIRGYFIAPSEPASGDTATVVTATSIIDTRLSSGVIPANGSLQVNLTNFAGITTSSITAVADTFNVISPAANGYLSVFPTGTSDPLLSAVNFYASDTAVGDFDNTLISSVTGNGNITVVNHSSGAIQLSIVARGYWLSATAPNAVGPIQSSYANGLASVSWQPPLDNGSPIESFQLTTSSGNTLMIAGNSSAAMIQATSTDRVTISAINSIGTSPISAQYDVNGSLSLPVAVASFPMTISGVLQPMDGSNQVVPAGISVEISTTQVPSTFLGDSSTYTFPVIGTAITQPGGAWSFIIQPFASNPSLPDLPSEAMTDASDNNGYLNLSAQAIAYGVVGNADYTESAILDFSTYIGTGIAANIVPPTAENMQFQSAVPVPNDTGTLTSLLSAWNSSSQSGDISHNVSEGLAKPQVGSTLGQVNQGISGLAFQSPNLGTDGTNLTNAPIISDLGSTATTADSEGTYFKSCKAELIRRGYDLNYYKAVLVPSWSRVSTGPDLNVPVPLGFVDAGNNSAASLTYDKGSSIEINTGFSSNYDTFSLGGSQTISDSNTAGIINSAQNMQDLYALGIVGQFIVVETVWCGLTSGFDQHGFPLNPMTLPDFPSFMTTHTKIMHEPVFSARQDVSVGICGIPGASSGPLCIDNLWKNQCSYLSWKCDGYWGFRNLRAAHYTPATFGPTQGWDVAAEKSTTIDLGGGVLGFSISVTTNTSSNTSLSVQSNNPGGGTHAASEYWGCLVTSTHPLTYLGSQQNHLSWPKNPGDTNAYTRPSRYFTC